MNRKEIRAFRQEMVLKEIQRASDKLMDKVMVLGSYIIGFSILILTVKNITQ